MWGASCEQGPVQGVAVGEAERCGSPASQPAGFARQGERAEQLTLQSGGEGHMQALFSPKLQETERTRSMLEGQEREPRLPLPGGWSSRAVGKC